MVTALEKLPDPETDDPGYLLLRYERQVAREIVTEVFIPGMKSEDQRNPQSFRPGSGEAPQAHRVMGVKDIRLDPLENSSERRIIGKCKRITLRRQGDRSDIKNKPLLDIGLILWAGCHHVYRVALLHLTLSKRLHRGHDTVLQGLIDIGIMGDM